MCAVWSDRQPSAPVNPDDDDGPLMLTYYPTPAAPAAPAAAPVPDAKALEAKVRVFSSVRA